MDTKRWLQEIDIITSAVKEEFQDFHFDQLNWKPNTKSWSIGQVIDHLIVINSSYFPIVRQLKEGSYKLIWLGKINFMVRFFGDLILGSVNPDRRKKMKTLPIWEPTNGSIDTSVVGRFVEQQQILKETIQNAYSLLERNVVISSPVNKIIVYKLERAFDIIITHECRHLEQARELNRLRN